MKTQHTPGPWHVGPVQPSLYYVETESGFDIAKCEFKVPGEFRLVGDSTKPEAEANARLISAAPELLEECERSLFEISQHLLNGNQFTEPMLKAWANGLRSAIAKATGN